MSLISRLKKIEDRMNFKSVEDTEKKEREYNLHKFILNTLCPDMITDEIKADFIQRSNKTNTGAYSDKIKSEIAEITGRMK